jgi:selenocysteine-specific elongation factor
MFVLGTAGHIDHGKSTLVRALTGMDPDRLREEKERGMTIDLGFAWLKLPSGREVGIVDVPGHERFVKNMLAGVGGIDLAMLVVSASDSVMPQTREHLAILDLLKVKKGIVVLTKKDTVDEDILNLVKLEVEELISSTTIAKAPIVAVSSITGDGIPELMCTIDALLDTAEPRRDLGRPRLPVDRVFTMTGSGTVVTGTLIDGSLSVGQEVEIVPSGLKSRLRSLQTHKSHIETAAPGSRVAANLVGINTTQIERGDVVTSLGWLTSTKTLTVKLSLLPYLPRPLRHGTEVSFFTGAAERLAKIRLLEGEDLKPGASTWAQLLLDRPVAAIKGDRFIIRSTMETLGGGDIVDFSAKRLRRFRPEVLENLQARGEGSSEEVILALLESKQPLEQQVLISQSNLPPEPTAAVIETLIRQNSMAGIGEGEHRLLFTAAGWEQMVRKASSILEEYHKKYPARPGMPKVEIISRLKLGSYAPSVLARLVSLKAVVEESNQVRLPGHVVKLTPDQQKKMDAFLKSLSENPYSPPGDVTPEPEILNLLIGQGRVVKVSDTVVFSSLAYNEMVAKVTAHVKAKGKVSLAEVRDMFQTSRKYAQALLEHLDAVKITRRVGDERVLY